MSSERGDRGAECNLTSARRSGARVGFRPALPERLALVYDAADLGVRALTCAMLESLQRLVISHHPNRLTQRSCEWLQFYTCVSRSSLNATSRPPKGGRLDRANARRTWQHYGRTWQHYGRMTASMTWMTPFVHSMSVLATLALSTMTLSPFTVMSTVDPSTVLASLSFTTSAAMTLPGTT